MATLSLSKTLAFRAQSAKQAVELFSILQRAQPWCIGRGNIDRNIVCKSVAVPKSQQIVFVRSLDRGVKILANIYTYNASASTLSDVGKRLLQTLIVKAQAINNRALSRKAKHSRLWVARLRPRSHSSELQPCKPKSLQGIGIVGIFVQARRQAHSMWKPNTHYGHRRWRKFKARRENRQHTASFCQPHRLEREIMR